MCKNQTYKDVYRINIKCTQPTQAFTSVELVGSEISNILHFFCTTFREHLAIRGKKRNEAAHMSLIKMGKIQNKKF